jgi:hypothetical protein
MTCAPVVGPWGELRASRGLCVTSERSGRSVRRSPAPGILAPNTVDQQADARTAVQDVFGGVSDAAVLLGVVLISLVTMGYRLRRRRSAREEVR